MQLSLYFESQQAAEQVNNHQALAPFFKDAHADKQAISTVAAYLEALGIKNAEGQFPLAALLMQQENLRLNNGKQSFLVQAVSLQLQRDTVVLAEQLSLTADEYADATQLLNAHFAEDEIEFITSETQQHWTVDLPTAPVSTYLPQQALYQDVHPYQPTGEGAKKLKQIMNEAQMLLHEHAMNHAREAQGLLPFNSIWLSGHGDLPQQLTGSYDALVGSSNLTKAMQQYTGVHVYENLEALNKQSASNAIMHLTSVEQIDWSLLYQMVKRWQVRVLQVHIAVGAETVRLTLTPMDCMKFWRKPKTFEQLLQTLN